MTRRILITLPDDPTLASQALAAIRAVPGVDVEEYEDDKDPAPPRDPWPDTMADVALADAGLSDAGRHRGNLRLNLDAVGEMGPLGLKILSWEPPARLADALHLTAGGRDWYVVGLRYDWPVSAVDVALMEALPSDTPPTYTVGDEEDGE